LKNVIDNKIFYHKSAKVKHCLLLQYTWYSTRTIMGLDTIMIKLEDIPYDV